MILVILALLLVEGRRLEHLGYVSADPLVKRCHIPLPASLQQLALPTALAFDQIPLIPSARRREPHKLSEWPLSKSIAQSRRWGENGESETS